MSFSARLARLVTGRPRTVLAAALLLTLALVPLAAKLRFDTDIYVLFPRDKPIADAFARFSKAFIAEPVVIVVIESSDTTKLDAFVDPFAAKLRTLPEIADVRHRLSGEAARFFRDHLLSLLDERDLAVLRERTEPAALRAQLQRIRGLLTAPGGSAMAPLLTADPLELLPLVAKRMGGGVDIDTTSGLFKSPDGHALLVYVRPRQAGDAEETRALLASITSAATQLGGTVVANGLFTGGANVELGFTGPSIYALHYRDWLHRDMTISTALSGFAVLLLFGVFFGALRVLPLVGLPLLVGLVWTAAAAQLLFGRVNAISLAFGTILFSIGIDLPIQLYNRLREELSRRELADALRHTIDRYAAPAILATLGPTAVFAACATSHFRGLRELGALAALGLLANCIAMLTVFPALLSALPGTLWGARAVPVPKRGVFHSLGAFATKRPRTILVVAGIALCASLPSALRVRFDRSLFSQPPDMPPSRVQAQLGRHFGQRDNAAIAYVEARGPESEDTLTEDVLQRSDAWLAAATQLRAQGLVTSFQSLSLLLPSQKTQKARRGQLDALDPKARGERMRAELEGLHFDSAPFAGFLAQLSAPPTVILPRDLPNELDFLVRVHLHRDVGSASVATYLYPVEGERNAEALRAIEHVAEGPAGGVVTGRPLLDPLLRDAAQADLYYATRLAIALVILLVVVHHRRWRAVVAILAPLTLAWVMFGATLTWLSIPLNLFDLLAIPLVIGYGIDDHVFLFDRFEEGGSANAAEALASTGRAVMVTSLATMAGFLPIAFARFPALRLLGITGALAVAWCLIAAFAVLPALLVLLFRTEGRRT